MKEVIPRIWVGSSADFGRYVNQHPKWSVVQAAKDPFHRQAVGYVHRCPDDGNPEYYFARRDNKLILNLTDARDVKYIWPEVIAEAHEFMDRAYDGGGRVFVHCNEGISRAPAIALMWLRRRDLLKIPDAWAAREEMQRLYPRFAPGPGIKDFIDLWWRG